MDNTNNMNSILTSIKKMLGITEAYTHFDTDVIIHINSAFSVLTQLGVGPKEGFFIEDDDALWSDFLEDDPCLSMVKTYVYLKVKQVFDSNTLSASVIDAMNRQIQELEWRINVAADGNNQNGTDTDSLVKSITVNGETFTPSNGNINLGTLLRQHQSLAAYYTAAQTDDAIEDAVGNATGGAY